MIINLKSEINNNKKLYSLLIIYVLFAATTYELFNRPFGDVKIIKIALDDYIPFIKELIIPYHTFMPMVILSGSIIFVKNKFQYKKLILVLFVAQITAYISFMIYQTYVPRYPIDLLGNDIFSKLVAATYSVDASYSGTPSMHVCVMLLCIAYIYKERIKQPYKTLMIIYMIFVALTTVLVKQHVVLDIPGGMVHAVLNYVFVEYLLVKKLKLLRE